jgi:hypothetical protein
MSFSLLLAKVGGGVSSSGVGSAECTLCVSLSCASVSLLESHISHSISFSLTFTVCSWSVGSLSESVSWEKNALLNSASTSSSPAKVTF